MSVGMFLTVFVTVFLAELGDKTQLATVLYAAEGRISNVQVFVAAASALVVSSAMSVIVGGWVGTHVPERTLRWVAGCGFIAVGLWTLIRR